MGGGDWGIEWDRFKQAQVPCAGFCLVANAAFDADLIKSTSGSWGWRGWAGSCRDGDRNSHVSLHRAC